MFDLDAYLADRVPDARLLNSSEGRKAITRVDPLLFALLYLPHHLRGDETGGAITLSEFHVDIVTQARLWAAASDHPAKDRDIYVAPRGCGKSTWFFLVLPLWAAAHGHRKFIAAFSDTATQAEMHLQTFRRELETNRVLRADFPTLCAAARRSSGASTADNRTMLATKSGFVFAARGIDSTTLGMKFGNQRPDLLILDDIEPGEENYSVDQKRKRLAAITDSVLPLNVYARVVIVGTVTMDSSIIHDAVRSVTLTEPPEPWLRDENFRVHYYPAILTNDDGTERSIWPAKWPMDYLEEIRHTRAFLKNYQNDPMGSDGDFWRAEDFTYGALPVLTHQLLSIDPAVTAKEKSDYTALAVIGYSATEKRCVVRDAWQLRIQPGAPLRARVLQILDAYPDIAGVLVETNQGGDAWKAILHNLPVGIRTVHQSIPKEVRAARLLAHYQRGRVMHEKHLPAGEAQMVSFPRSPHDDLVDAIGSGVAVFLGKPTKPPAKAATTNYAKR